MRPDFDRARFALDVSAWLKRNGLSYREATGMHPALNTAMLSRACSETALTIPSFLVICSVAGLEPAQYLVLPDQQNQTVTVIGKRETRIQ